MSEPDTIGIVREHRWITADAQAKLLRPDCRAIRTLGGGRLTPTTIEALAKIAKRPGTVIALVHAFLLAKPGPTRTMKASLRHTIALLTEHGGIVRDVATGMSTGTKAQTQALVDMASVQIGRSNQGADSATNGARSQGPQPLDLSPEDMRDAKAVWRDLIEYPEWEDAARGLKRVHKKFTVWRAHKLWGPRQAQR